MMVEAEFTKASSKGQVVIPSSIRKRLGVEEGTPFAVWSRGDEILLKKMSMPRRRTWQKTTAPFRSLSKKRKITLRDINRAVLKVRAQKRL